jgi:hypothetical protein
MNNIKIFTVAAMATQSRRRLAILRSTLPSVRPRITSVRRLALVATFLVMLGVVHVNANAAVIFVTTLEDKISSTGGSTGALSLLARRLSSKY